MMITLADIAKRAGVSVFTVSCALRGTGRVAEQTGVRIRALAAEMGYVPNMAGRLLAEGRQRAKGKVSAPAIAVVRFGVKGHSSEQRDMQRMIEVASAEGYAAHVVNYEDYSSPARMGKVLWSQGVEGLLLLTTNADPGFSMAQLVGMPWEKFSLVRISRGIDDLHCHTVRSSAFSETKYALERIVDAGYRRIGVILLTHSASREDDFGRHGALRAFEDLEKEKFDWMGVFRYEIPIRAGLPDAVNRWLKKQQPDVVLGFPVVWRIWLEYAGYKIPQDFAFAGLPVQLASESGTGVATTGTLNDFFTREFPAALQMLHEEMAAGRRGLPEQPYEHVLPVIWQEGVTMPDARRRDKE